MSDLSCTSVADYSALPLELLKKCLVSVLVWALAERDPKKSIQGQVVDWGGHLRKHEQEGGQVTGEGRQPIRWDDQAHYH